MKCIWCDERREATQDIYCQKCNDELDAWAKARMDNTFIAARMRLHNAWIELLVALGIGKAVIALNNALLKLKRWIA